MSRRKDKAQAGVELVILVAFSLILFSSIYMQVLKHNFQTINEKRNHESEKVSELIGYELDIATSMGHGYEKELELPKKILGKEYSINITSNLVILQCSQTYITYMITPNISGTIIPGTNIVENENGEIHVSQP